jgi:hypothetical protein
MIMPYVGQSHEELVILIDRHERSGMLPFITPTYPNAFSLYYGMPDASVAINVGGSFTYYYLAPDAGTYFCQANLSGNLVQVRTGL